MTALTMQGDVLVSTLPEPQCWIVLSLLPHVPKLLILPDDDYDVTIGWDALYQVLAFAGVLDEACRMQ